MRSKERGVPELEAELLRLNALVRERRQQLARLQSCPNPLCPCRVVWREQVEKGLASQVRKIRKHVRATPGRGARASSAIGKRRKRQVA
ncbi:MAG: hypothetical protein ABSF95_10950 [Verrucomicrobiota bacterium]|jgi:hypothetical protein